MSGIIINPYSFATGSAFSTKSLDFDGVDDYVDTDITNTGTNDISVSCWIKTTETFSYTVSRCAFGGRSNIGGTNYTLGRLGSGFATPDDMVVRLFNNYGTTKLNDDDWHNIVYTYNFTTKEVKAYVDGNTTAEATTTFAAWNTNYQIAIGWNGFDTSYYFEGNVDECAYFTRVLGASDITEIYNNGAPGDISGISDLEKWWRMGENSTFSSPQILMPENTNKDKVSNFSMDFDGTDDYVDCGNDSSLDLTTLSISLWVKFDYTSGNKILIGKDYTSSYYINSAGGAVTWWTNGSSLSTIDINIDDGNWHHLLCTASASSKDIYMDGVSKASGAGGVATVDTDNLYIGNSPVLNAPFQGKIDEVSLFNSVKAVGDLWDGTGQPTDLTGESGLVGYWKMGEEAVFNSTNWLLPNKAQDVFSRYSMEFDGVDDYVDCGNNASLHNPNFTISAWVYQPSISGSDEIISNGLGAFGAKDHGFNINRYFGNYRFYIGDGTTSYSSSWAGAVVDTWQHLVMSYDGTDMKAYLNGVLKDTVAVPSISYSASAQNLFRIGKSAQSGLEFTGNIDEVSLFDSAKAIGDLWDGSGKPTDLTGQSGLVSWWRMGEDATFSTNWTIPDKIGSNTGTSANMTNDDLSGNAPAVTGNGTSANMDINDRTGDAPDSSNNALSYNMDAADIEEEAP